MSQLSYLGGKVLKQTLPLVQAPVGTDAPVLKRMVLPQGLLVQFYDADEPIRYLAFLELKPGCVRGNHYHQIKLECVYIIRGTVSLAVLDVASGARESVPLEAGDVARIETGVAHALAAATPGEAIEFSPARFSPRDTYKVPVV